MQHQGLHLTAYILQSGYAIDEMAELMDVEEAYLAEILDKAIVPEKVIKEIAWVFAVSVEELMAGALTSNN